MGESFPDNKQPTGYDERKRAPQLLLKSSMLPIALFVISGKIITLLF